MRSDGSGTGKATPMRQYLKVTGLGRLRLAALTYAVVVSGFVWALAKFWPSGQIAVAAGAVILTVLLTGNLIVRVLMQMKTSLTGLRSHVSDLRTDRDGVATAAHLAELKTRLDEMERRLLDLQRWQRKHHEGGASVARALTGQSIRLDLLRADWAEVRKTAPIRHAEDR